MHRPAKVLIWVVSLVGLWFAVHTAAATWYGLHDDVQQADAIVVLGNKVERSGVPSARLRERLDRALELHRQGLAPAIIVSGGTGREGFDEAAVMRDYLVAHGVPEAAVIVDSLGYDTRQTALNAARIMDGRGMRSTIVISQYYHIPRTRLAFVRAGVEVVHSAHARVALSFREPYNLFREFVAYYYYLVRPW